MAIEVDGFFFLSFGNGSMKGITEPSLVIELLEL